MASANQQPREIIRFDWGKPEVMRLKYATGRQVNGKAGPQIMFTTVDDRICFLDFDIANRIEAAKHPDRRTVPAHQSETARRMRLDY